MKRLNKKISVKLATVITTFAVVFTIIASILAFSIFYPSLFSFFGGNTAVKRNAKLAEIQYLIEQNYYGEIDSEKLLDGLSAGMAAGIEDKYAAYISAEKAEEQKASYKGLSVGIGVNIVKHPDNETIYIYNVFEGGPAQTIGLTVGDEIVAIDNERVKEIGYEKAVEKLRTKAVGETVDLTCNRSGNEFQIGIAITEYNVQSVFGKLIDDIGYVLLTTFNETTPTQFKAVVEDLISNGAKSLVFDLRGNTGGLIDSVSEILDYLLPEGTIISVKYKDETKNETYTSDAAQLEIPMAVLVNSTTASASELFAASLQEQNKAVIIGTKTYGKGVVQSTYTLSDGSMFKLTVAKYYTGGDFCPDGVGVTPNVITEWTDDELSHRIINGINKDKDFLEAVNQLSLEEAS